jgi:ribosomal protein S27E
MRVHEEKPDEQGLPDPKALGRCPVCATTIDDPLACEVGHWDGILGGPLYRIACPVCGTVLMAFASGEEAVAEIQWIAIEE